MPVRIYDISKKLGLDNKQVLAKANELNLTAARVASSSLDKITAEYLEQQLILAHPELAAPPPPPPPPPAPPPVATPPPSEQPIAAPATPPQPAVQIIPQPEAVAAPAPAPASKKFPNPKPLPAPAPAPAAAAAAPAAEAPASPAPPTMESPPIVSSELPPETKPAPVVERSEEHT